MKWTAQRIICFAGQLVCFIGLPLLFIWLQYAELQTTETEATTAFKLPATALLVAVLVLVLAKRIFLNNFMTQLNARLANMETQFLVTTDQRAIDALKKSYKWQKLVEIIISAIIPACVLGLALLVCQALEAGTIKLFGVLRLTACSFVLGFSFRVAEVLTLKSKQEAKK